jgi:phosphoribosylformylglycinamidine synthase subunit PurQ / glutaminase
MTGDAPKWALVPRFHGTNCDAETLHWLTDNLMVKGAFLPADAQDPQVVQYNSQNIACVVVPGGFSFGDYLRAGALAARSASLKKISQWAHEGVPVLGICNGFQILCEAGLLPGVLVRNENRQHNHFPVELSLAFEPQDKSPCVWWPQLIGHSAQKSLRAIYSHFRLPMSCGVGKHLPQGNTRPLLRYVANENGSVDAVAAVFNEKGNVLGMMPHPERASEAAVGGTQGLVFLYGLSLNKGIAIRPGSALATFAQSIEKSESLPASQGVLA